MAKNLNEISQYLKNLNFKKKRFGGIDEIDVWNKIDKLNAEYKELYQIQQVKIETLEERLNGK